MKSFTVAPMDIITIGTKADGSAMSDLLTPNFDITHRMRVWSPQKKYPRSAKFNVLFAFLLI